MSNLLQEQAIQDATNPTRARVGISGGGKTFFVSSVIGSDSANNGRTPKTPYATISKAVTNCTASKGDTIFLMEGHAETTASAAALTVSKAGISIIGLGVGSLRPTLTWATLSTATLTMTAANCSFENVIFDMSLPSALVSGIVISAAGCQIKGCLFKIGTAGAGTRPLQAILTTAAANYLKILDNQFLEPSATPTTVSAASCAIKLVGGTGIQIKGNFFSGWYTLSVGAITSITTLNDNIQITDNYILNQTASATKGVVLLTGSTGAVMRNIFGIGSGAAPITGDAAWRAGNWSAAAVATDGTLV